MGLALRIKDSVSVIWVPSPNSWVTPHESTHNFFGCQRMLSDYTEHEDMKKARFYAGFFTLLDFLGLYKIIKWWRRRELNPRPETVHARLLHA